MDLGKGHGHNKFGDDPVVREEIKFGQKRQLEIRSGISGVIKESMGTSPLDMETKTFATL